MIVLIQICKEYFHYFEFVKPIEDVLRKANMSYSSIQYEEVSKDLLSKANKVIICGTSLKDNLFLDDLSNFNWINSFDKPILGICGGMHILGLLFGGELKKCQEIGVIEIDFKEEFLGMVGRQEVYELHNYNVVSKEFHVYATSERCIQAIKHKKKPYYAVQFHPEARNKNLLLNFIKNIH